jgi:hypothetical protein
VAAARALGDYSHKVYTPALVGGDMAGAAPDELLILDVWEKPEGIQQFFSDEQVRQGGAKLFSKRDPVVFMPAEGAYAFNLPAPMGKNERFVGLLRATVKSPQQAMDLFRATNAPLTNLARQRGQLSHQLYFKLAPPAADGSAELLGVDVWTSLEGMGQHYQEHMAPLMPAFLGRPSTSIWSQPAGEWTEW